MHDVLRCSLLPKGKVASLALLRLTIEIACGIDQFLDLTARKATIRELLVVLLDIEINASLAHIGITGIKDLLHVGNLFDDMTRGMRLDGWWEDVECLHSLVITVQIILNYLHRLFLLQTSLLGDLIFALISIVLEMAYIGDVAAITDFVANVLQITIENIESDGWTSVSEVTVAIDGRTADVHADMIGSNRLERLFNASQRIVDV